MIAVDNGFQPFRRVPPPVRLSTFRLPVRRCLCQRMRGVIDRHSRGRSGRLRLGRRRARLRRSRRIRSRRCVKRPECRTDRCRSRRLHFRKRNPLTEARTGRKERQSNGKREKCDDFFHGTFVCFRVKKTLEIPSGGTGVLWYNSFLTDRNESIVAILPISVKSNFLANYVK